MSAEQNEDVDNVEEYSDSLAYLQQEDGSRDSNIKKRVRPWGQKESDVQKVFVPNRGKEKRVEVDSQYSGMFLYKPGVQLPSLYNFVNQTIIVASEYIRRTNPQLLRRNIYGSDPYTSNSDAVCIGVHVGAFNLNTVRKYEGVELVFKVVKPKKNYAECQKYGLMSRAMKGYNGNALKYESVNYLSSLGSMDVLEKCAANMHIPIGKNRVRSKSKNICNVIPVPQTHIVFNCNNQPAYKYSIFNIADKGFDKNDYMIRKLDHYVLYLETESGEKYQIAKKQEMNAFDVFRVAKVKNSQRSDNAFFKNVGCPLENQNLEILCANAEWDQIYWGNSSIIIKNQQSGKEAQDLRIEKIRSFKYYKKTDTK